VSLSQAEVLAEYLAGVPRDQWEREILAIGREVFGPSILSLGDFDAAVAHNWDWYGRPEQIWRPGPETYTVYCAGRGFGKTACGAHAADYVGLHPELCGGRAAEGPDDWRAGEGARMAIAGRTANDVNTEMIDGDAGVMAACDPALRPEWKKNDRLLIWPTGVTCKVMSADVPDSFRGPNIGWFWWDEWAHARRLRSSWRQLRRTHRLASRGQHPRGVITTTPLGHREMIDLVWECHEGHPVKAEPGDPREFQGHVQHRLVRCVGGSSYDNAANLAAEYLTNTVASFEGTDDGPQENHGIIRIGVPGSPWRLNWIQRFVDPTVSEHEEIRDSDEPCECGIVAAGFHQSRRRMYALEDASLVAAPHLWAQRVVDAVIRHRAAEVVCEDNNGGALLRIVVSQALEARRSEIDWSVQIRLCTATRDKLGRAILAAPCWQRERVWHVGSPRGWVALEGQLTQLDPNRPIRTQRTDRLDAVVWAALTFFGDGTDQTRPFPQDGAQRWAQIVAAVQASRR